MIASSSRLTVPLRDVVFFRELPVLLGVSEDYVTKLITPPRGENLERMTRLAFPKPFLTSQGGIRVWKYVTLESWAISRRVHGDFASRTMCPIVDDPVLARSLLGRS